MATPTCTTAGLLETIPCFSPQVLNPHQNLALQIWMLANELDANGGTDYTSDLSSTATGGLIKAANDLFERAYPAQLDQAELTIYRNNAASAGASISSDIDTLLNSVADLQLVDMAMLEKMKLTLLCKLGSHRTPPA